MAGGGAYFTNSRVESNKKVPGGKFYKGQHYLFYDGSTKLMALQFWSLEVIPWGFCEIHLFPGPPKNAHWWDLSYLERQYWHETVIARWTGARSGSGTSYALFHLGPHNSLMVYILLFSFLLQMRKGGLERSRISFKATRIKRGGSNVQTQYLLHSFLKLILTRIIPRNSLCPEHGSWNEWEPLVSHTICPVGVAAAAPPGPSPPRHRNVSVLSAGQLVPALKGEGGQGGPSKFHEFRCREWQAPW